MIVDTRFHTRRRFLRTTVLGGALAWTVPAFIDRTFAALDAAAIDSATQVATGKDHPILVVLQLSGGNDGLNTVVPFEDDAYYRLRPKISIPKGEVLQIADGLGLNPSLEGMLRTLKDGRGAIIQNVGYPNPNRSHFRSMEIWHTASGADGRDSSGWLGRYFNNCCQGADPEVGVALGRSMPQAFQSEHPLGVTIPSVEKMRSPEDVFDSMDDGDAEMAGGTVESLGGHFVGSGNPLDYIERVGLDTRLAVDRIAAATRGAPEAAVKYPGSALGQQLKTVSQLIGGGMTTRVYYVEQGGYDTHATQANRHPQLLADLDAALSAFLSDLEAQGNLGRVMVMTFSEFGRRIAENQSGGTDHGAAAPVFVFGGSVKPGLFGEAHDLSKSQKGDVDFRVDFRSVYATILERWLGVPSASVLGNAYSPLGFV